MANVSSVRVNQSAKFSDYHIWKALMCMDDRVPIGRKKLSLLLNIGEGSTRTLLGQLNKYGCTYTDKTGIYLSEEGMKVRNSVLMDMVHMDVGYLTISEFDCAVRVPFAANKIRYGREESDAAIRNGAIGATTLVFNDGKLCFPGTVDRVEPEVEATFNRTFHLRNNDVIIIGTAKTPEDAERGAVSVALSLIGGLKFRKDLHGILSSSANADELISLAFAIHELIGLMPVCAKSKNNLGVRIEDGMVIDNAYTGEVLEEVIRTGKTMRVKARSGPYKGTHVIVTPIDLDGTVIAAIGVVDIKQLFSESR